MRICRMTISSPFTLPVRRARVMALAIGLWALVLAMLLPATSVEASSTRVNDRSLAVLAEEALESLALWHDRESPTHYVAYLEGRDRVLATIAGELDVVAGELEATWAELPLVRQVVALTAIAQVGIRYRYLGKNPSEGFDCSGLTGYAWGAIGMFIGHNSRSQYNAATRVDREDAVPGDLVWYPGHIMLYLGAGDVVVHAPRTGRDVEVRRITESRQRSARFASPLT